MSPLPLKEQLKALEHIQELDLNIRNLNQKKDTLPNALKEIDRRLNVLKADLNKRNKAVTELEKTLTQTLAAIELNEDRSKRADEKLTGIQNTKEFQAMNNEVTQLKKLKDQLDVQKKKTEADIETAKKSVEEASGKVEELQKERDAKNTELDKEAGSFNVDLDKLQEERGKYTDQVEKQTLARYDRVRKAREGQGLVAASDGRCTGCNMLVPPQMYNQLFKYNELISCPSCHRILFMPEQKDEQVEAEAKA